jgi:alpha-N-arabinofuranosidase
MTLTVGRRQFLEQLGRSGAALAAASWHAVSGGNFVSGCNWLDGVGPRAARPAVIERAWNSLETNQVDAISLHNYYGNTPALTGNSTARYLAMNLDMERQILEIGAVCDYVQGIRKSPKRLWLSFDEWNVWYRARGGDFADGKRTAAPILLEEVYNLEDALLVGGFLNSLLRQSDRVRIGCLAQIVNVIAPLVTNERGVLRQSIFHPYAWALQYARGRVVDVAVTVDAASGRARALMLNRDLDAERELILEWQAPTPTRVLACETLTGPDLKAFNTFAAPDVVAPRRLDAPAAGPRMAFKLPPCSYTVAHLATG